MIAILREGVFRKRKKRGEQTGEDRKKLQNEKKKERLGQVLK